MQQKNEGLVGCYDDVVRMEALRTKFGKHSYAEIFATLIPMEHSRMRRLAALDAEEQATAFGATRILMAVTREQIRNSLEFQDARSWASLASARMSRVFSQRNMQIAKNVNIDPNGNEYLYGQEMCRDLAAVSFLYARVFGDVRFVDFGVDALEIVATNETASIAAQANYENLLQRRVWNRDAVSASQLLDAYNMAQLEAASNAERGLTNAARLAGTWQADIRDKGIQSLKELRGSDAKLQLRIVWREMFKKPLGERLLRRRMGITRPANFDASSYYPAQELDVIRNVFSS